MQACLSSSTSPCDASISPYNASIEVAAFKRMIKADDSSSPEEIADYLHKMPHLDPKMVRIAQILMLLV